jgi:hypothetical protein
MVSNAPKSISSAIVFYDLEYNTTTKTIFILDLISLK